MAIQDHTARFRLVPQLAKGLSSPTPAVRKPGSARTELPRPPSTCAEPVGHVRLGYAHASTARQSLDAQLDSLTEAGVTRVYSEQISTWTTRVTATPEERTSPASLTAASSSGRMAAGVVDKHGKLLADTGDLG